MFHVVNFLAVLKANSSEKNQIAKTMSAMSVDK